MHATLSRIASFATLVAGIALPAVAEARAPGPRATTLAVIGDTPYGPAQVADFPGLIADINADPDVRRVIHVGDVKSGSTRCDTSYFEALQTELDTFADPVVVTPGDNDWTDCHRANNGKYDPLERLEAFREIFYPRPGRTLGARQAWVFSQAFVPGYEDFVENQLWEQSDVVFSTLHVVGSRDGLAPWFGDDSTDPFVDDPERRTAEVAARQRANLDFLRATFALAAIRRARAVAIFMQADTWVPAPEQRGAFQPVIALLAELSARFKRPVLLVQGDSHVYNVDRPLENGDASYGVTTAVPNLTRLVVEGETTAEWLKLAVDPNDPAVFSWTRVLR